MIIKKTHKEFILEIQDEKIENTDNYCVYYHKNRLNNKLYIGISKDVKKRWSANGGQYKYSKVFYRAIKKYGWNNFDHVILIDNISKDIACVIESELIKKYKTQDKEFGYNLANGGFGGCTAKGEKHHLSKKVYQYSLDGKFIQEWENAQRAAEKIGVCVSDIHTNCRRNKIKRAGNFMWSYEKYEFLEPYIHEGVGKESIIQLDSNFNIVNRYKNISYINDALYNKDRVTNCCKRRSISHNGFYWAYEKDFDISLFISYIKDRTKKTHKNSLSKSINQYDLNGNIIHTYESARDAEEKTGFNRHTIQAYCKRKIGNSGESTGYIWKYA